MAVIWCSCGSQVVYMWVDTRWVPEDNQVNILVKQYKSKVVFIWCPIGIRLSISWHSSELDVRTMWSPPGYHLSTKWFPGGKWVIASVSVTSHSYSSVSSIPSDVHMVSMWNSCNHQVNARWTTGEVHLSNTQSHPHHHFPHSQPPLLFLLPS